MASGIGISSKNTVKSRLRRLEMMGKIEVWKDKPRAIKLLGYQFVKVDGGDEGG
ncbi:MAG: hypothetical protein HFI75_15760 [Lachnospiraceae bacterium]|nr:hypothetical protein [Lachnospiraceae bacterium]